MYPTGNFPGGVQTGNNVTLFIDNPGAGIDFQSSHRMMHRWFTRRCIKRRLLDFQTESTFIELRITPLLYILIVLFNGFL